MFHKIVVPVAMDQIERGEATLRKAAGLLDPGGEILLLNVVEDFQGYLAIDFPVELIEAEQKEAGEKLVELKDRLAIPAKTEVRYGSAAREINKAVAEHGADLVVIASHRPGLADYFLGATADRVVRHCPVSVLVDR